MLTAARVALNPVDPRGLALYPIPYDDHAMEEMAKATGGVVYYNRNDLDAAMGEAIAAGADYYSLSYVPPLSKYDGQFHKIDVKVDRPSVHLQYRDGYTAVDLAKHPQPTEKSSGKTAKQPDSESHTFMGHGVAPSTQRPRNAVTAPARPGDPPVMG